MWNGISLQFLFTDDQWYSAFCVCVLAICVSSLKKRLYRLLSYFLIGVFIILLCSYECSIYYRHKFFVICMICKCFLPFSGMSLCFLCGIFWNTVLNFDEGLSVFFPVFIYTFGVCVLRSILWCHLSVLQFISPRFHSRVQFHQSSQVKGQEPQQIALPSDSSFWRAPVSPHFCLPRWASCNPLRVSSSPGRHNSLKAPALWLQFYLKGRSSGTAKWRTRPGQSGGSSRIPSVCVLLARHPTSTDLASVLKLGVRSLCVEALWLSRIDEFIDHMVEPSVLLSSPPGRMIWSRVPVF